MIWNVMMGTAAAAAALASWGFVQDPGFDYEVATPEASSPLRLATFQREATVSVRFHDAKVGEVLGWLEKQGVSFVVADAKLKDRTITMSVTNQTVNAVADAIASALGGRWQRQGSILIYRDGPDGFFQFRGPKGESLFAPNSKLGPSWQVNPKGLDGLSTAPVPMGQFYRFDQAKPIAPTAPKISGDAFRWEQVKPITPDKTLKDWSDQVKVFSKDGGDGVFVMKGRADLEKLVKSLTDKQRDMMRNQGYLKLNDLTSEQRDMLGIGVSGTFPHLDNTPENLGIQIVPDNGERIIIRDKQP